MSDHIVTISGPAESGRFYADCSCGWTHSASAVVTAAVVWGQHAKEAA